MYRLALESDERQLGNNHPETLRVVTLLGQLAVSQGDFSEGAILFRRSIDGYRCVHGPDHRSVFEAMLALGDCLLAHGRNLK